MPDDDEYVEGEVHVFDLRSGAFVPASRAEHSGTGPCLDDYATSDEIDAAAMPRSLSHVKARGLRCH